MCESNHLRGEMELVDGFFIHFIGWTCPLGYIFASKGQEKAFTWCLNVRETKP